MMAALLTIVGVVGVVFGFRARKKAIEDMKSIQQEYRDKRRVYTLMLRKAIAELVDWRREFKKRDGQAEEVLTYMSEIHPSNLIAQKAEKYE